MLININLVINCEAILCRFELKAIGFLWKWNYWQLWKVYLGNIPSRYLAGCSGYISGECAIYTLAQALTRAATAANRQIRYICNTFSGYILEIYVGNICWMIL